MRFNTTVALTLLLLTTMFGAGFVSAMAGFTVGHEALKGVTQPDARPTNKLKANKKASPTKENLEFLREEDIIKNVITQMNKKGKNPPAAKNKPPEKKKTEPNRAENSTDNSSSQKPIVQLKFPIKAQAEGVTLQVISVSHQNGSLLLNVSMKNQGTNAVRFLYSFLNITDDKGRPLSAVTEGLPGELPSNGEEFAGTVSIPTALLNDAQKLSLSLTDYPDQKLQLQLPNIPL